MSIRITGAAKLNRDLRRMAEDMWDMRAVFEEVTRLLEASETRLFAELDGRYVRTGAMRDSLTMSGEGVRDINPTSLRFGSDVYYARFQVKNPGPVTPKGGLQRKGHPSAVLRLTNAQAHQIAQDAMEHITREADL